METWKLRICVHENSMCSYEMFFSKEFLLSVFVVLSYRGQDLAIFFFFFVFKLV